MGGAIGLLYSQWVAKREIGRETKIREKRVIFYIILLCSYIILMSCILK